MFYSNYPNDIEYLEEKIKWFKDQLRLDNSQDQKKENDK
jgi:hypothetical protein